jgi:hypothetical protein
MSFAKRLTRSGSDFELIIGEGIGAATFELRRAFERVSQKILAHQLCELDDSLGVSAALFMRTRFQLLREAKEAKDGAEAKMTPQLMTEPEDSATALQSRARTLGQ